MRIISINLCFLLLLMACSTQTYISDPQKMKGKRLAVAEIVLNTFREKDKVRTDTLCYCLAASVAETLYPYLQQTGMTIVQHSVTGKPVDGGVFKMADSLHLDYIIIGSGLIEFSGKTAFMNTLSLKIVDVKSLEVKGSGSFSGPSVSPAGAARRIGKKLVSQIKNK